MRLPIEPALAIHQQRDDASPGIAGNHVAVDPFQETSLLLQQGHPFEDREREMLTCPLPSPNSEREEDESTEQYLPEVRIHTTLLHRGVQELGDQGIGQSRAFGL